VVLESLDDILGSHAPAELSDGDGTSASAYGYGMSSDPLGAGLPNARGLAGDQGDIPEIPALGRPVQVQLDLVRRLVERGAAFVVDSREHWEYDQGHLPGALLIPHAEASDLSRLRKLDTGRRPIVVYCGGGACETSIRLGSALTEAGHDRVLVFMGGFPAWEAAGLPVEQGSGGSGGLP
jgi:rhodanese-related sulfurtransferase